MLAAAQLTLVSLTGAPEWALEQKEGEALSEALARVATHYPALQMAVSTKVRDHVFAIACVGQIAFVHVTAYNARMRAERAERARNVTPAPVAGMGHNSAGAGFEFSNEPPKEGYAS